MARIGAHVSISGGVEQAFRRGEDLSCEAIQIFTKNQLQWRSAPISQTRAERFLRAWSESSVTDVVVHASYLINLAATDATGERSLVALEDEIERCDILGIDDLVLHPGSSRGNPVDDALRLVAARLGTVLDRTGHKRVNILLETMSGQGNHLGADFREFTRIFELLDWHPRMGLCLDTCHMFSAGFDMRTEPAYGRLMRQIDQAVGFDRVRCWHFNDSSHPLGRRLDRHAHIGEGELGYAPFSFVLNDPLWEDVPCILETPQGGCGYAGDMSLLRKMRGG
ncbi:deoxyribonuclease IV [Aminivibrio sp.]|jgi:deoxyribonuclease-4|uniref:deoxyribonuclease IV n=1 Tax=Aminivibrio sp. TaxID=1872489 RepID=UPI0016A03979|nr:deoxyribonuclease IV [Synergistaceae bacterium]NLO58775.1 deoxyribonuclease IV [Synergistaceae bacterium]